jgi:inosine/xanthosine triphosphatase
MNIAIGSTNPVKIAATLKGFQKVWPKQKWEAQGFAVSSGVSAQPMSDKETIQGGRNRADAALAACPEAEYGVGLEGGIQQIGDQWFDCGWIIVHRRDGKEGIGSSIRMQTPAKMIKMVEQGMELGDIVDQLCEVKNAKQANGHFGLMSNNIITRESGYTDGVVAALVAFLQPELFSN